ncbi:MAG: Asp-tRNA(Asn)/Glu-tRNA(Gln) amidotransferase subunit GatB [Planctomycetota bacterium]|nr:Asp-tRNA(Asn)/Glu-tRNA(Gln) amidotransferase subunit GatB [Planctomycetota bacterium]MCX8039580.1 Asp-tRNA(Asn)/Glu-tRNA(Gln) amidotransferase subunit GatB [Planctomycetota bacterium]MDW8373129.1 Asp-tRNA(Asn)/Glu-tRNA(Gln) amidotransferase subunit GatB [Planctomycetota bacterium]
MDADYEAVIGLEVHCQLQTESKLFSGARAAFGAPPNTLIDPTVLGLPGALPVVNARAVELAVRAALAFGGQVQERSLFERKHYFYPDLPKGYQISQYERPYCLGGAVTIDLPEGGTRDIGLVRIHLEEDAGKLMHDERGPWSRVDLNRAGVPLIEIVSQPDLRSPAEAYAYLWELRRVLRWVGVSDCEMQEGSLRCDANVSVRRRGEQRLGTRVEIKNLNSLRHVEAAIAYEIARQSALCRAGRAHEIERCTVLWDPDAKVTRPMRGKEDAADYRYFPDPDLPPLRLSAERIAAIRAAMPDLPRQRERWLCERYGIEPAAARELTQERAVADFVEDLIRRGAPPRLAANWTREEALRRVAETGKPIAEALPPALLAAVIALVESGQVARVVAKAELDALLTSGEPPAQYFASRGMIQVQDSAQLAAWVAQAIAAEPKAAAELRAGNDKAIGRLVGVTMKLSGGKAQPQAVQAEIRRQLGL